MKNEGAAVDKGKYGASVNKCDLHYIINIISIFFKTTSFLELFTFGPVFFNVRIRV
jgi:hypothetical protein